jgi:acyl-CoA thioesterase
VQGERWPEDLADVRAELDASFRANPYLSHLGIALDDWGMGWARLRMEGKPQLGNLAGTVHGGALASLADAAFEVACNSYGRRCVAAEITVHYSAPAPVGARLHAEATERARSRRLGSYDITVLADGTPVALFLALAYRTAGWHLDEGRYPPAWRERY